MAPNRSFPRLILMSMELVRILVMRAYTRPLIYILYLTCCGVAIFCFFKSHEAQKSLNADGFVFWQNGWHWIAIWIEDGLNIAILTVMLMMKERILLDAKRQAFWLPNSITPRTMHTGIKENVGVSMNERILLDANRQALECIYGPVFWPHANRPHTFLDGICEVWLSTSICLVSFCVRSQKKCVRSEKSTPTKRKNRFFRAVGVEYILRWNSTLKPCRQNRECAWITT